ncbi:MAG: metal-dependent hydrolase [Anaerolineales bacterium]|nr:metal-dependent hydrolase [Anaerolineales bacterium]
MNGSGHFVLGCGTGLLVAGVAQSLGMAAPSQTQLLAGMVIAGVAAFGPDVDCQGSTINRTAPFLLAAGVVLLGLIPGIAVELPSQVMDSPWLRHLQSFWPLFTLQQVAGGYLFASAVGLVITPHTVQHRGPTHSLAFTTIVTTAVMAAFHVSNLPLLYACCFGAGWSSHLAADAFTEEGLPEWDWLLPSWWASN